MPKYFLRFSWEKGILRFGELHKRMDGVSEKVLTSNLRALEKDKLIVRKVYPEVPPRVEYSLTDAGRDIVPLIQQLSEWSHKNLV